MEHITAVLPHDFTGGYTAACSCGWEDWQLHATPLRAAQAGDWHRAVAAEVGR